MASDGLVLKHQAKLATTQTKYILYPISSIKIGQFGSEHFWNLKSSLKKTLPFH